MRLLTILLTLPMFAYGQGTCQVRHLAIFDANIVEVMEERTLQLQAGSNAVEWRSLMPQAVLATLRVTSDQVTVVRQNVTLDGSEVRGQKAPVLHLVLQNGAAAGPRKVQVDYLAPGLSWKGEYTLQLGRPVGGAPEEMFMDGWLSVQNGSGMDVCAEFVDLIAGEVQLLTGGGSAARDFVVTSQQAAYRAPEPPQQSPGAEIAGVSVFSRLRLGKDILLLANALNDRFPLFQRLKLPVEQPNIFENDSRTQTVGRGGFMLQPVGLEVRLVSKNNSSADRSRRCWVAPPAV